MKIERRHLTEVQYARAFAIFAVLAVHSSSTGVTLVSHSSFTFLFYNFFNIAGKLGTPTFIFLSSFVLFYTYYYREFSFHLLKQFYKKRLLYILVPYLFFSIVYFSVVQLIYGEETSWALLIRDFFIKLATGDAYAHLYFVFVSVQFYLMFPVLLLLFKKSAFIRRYALPIGIALQWSWVWLNAEFFQSPMKGSIAFSYFMFYFFGAFLGVNYEKIAVYLFDWKRYTLAIAAIFIGYGFMMNLYVGVYYLTRTGQLSPSNELVEFAWSMHALFASSSIFIVVHFFKFWKNEWVKNMLYEIGAVSFGIYLIHPLFLLFLRAALPSGTPIVFHSWQLFTLIVIFIGSWLIVRLTFNYLPYSWIIFGKDGTPAYPPAKTARKANA
ncbi:acyltransferase [Planococcus lenghuensis]|uniref:Acyltransferase n=1 Tax=Planococcus lenghuensis TaxID=2213202 RepID=A0A1Q2L0U7_9BACL|nr:acyltransferase [Planococcus lenghuensis]AQQ54051.1 acyltransferase [Planococcus lenghuensis]